MIQESTLTIFLVSGITIKIREKDKIYVATGGDSRHEISMLDLYHYLEETHETQDIAKFEQELINTYKEKEKDKEQTIKHKYHLPYDKIAWFLLEEV